MGLHNQPHQYTRSEHIRVAGRSHARTHDVVGVPGVARAGVRDEAAEELGPLLEVRGGVQDRGLALGGVVHHLWLGLVGWLVGWLVARRCREKCNVM
jgi:hypothetical protein